MMVLVLYHSRLHLLFFVKLLLQIHASRCSFDLVNAPALCLGPEAVDEALSLHAGQDLTIVVISECAAKLLVVHGGVTLVGSPLARTRLSEQDLEDASLPVDPCQQRRLVLIRCDQQVSKEDPEADASSSLSAAVHPFFIILKAVASSTTLRTLFHY